MPLLMCPNDNAPMQTVDRSGVRFDMCPTCRGVWLDRGELEQLMDAAARDAAPASAPQTPTWSQDRREPRHDGYRRDDDHGYRRKKRDSIFDIFD